MSAILEAIVAELSKKDTSGYHGSAKFVIEDQGSVILDSDGVRIGDDEADVTLKATLDTFRGIFEGNVNPTSAFMTGKLKIDGAMGRAMALASVLS